MKNIKNKILAIGFVLMLFNIGVKAQELTNYNLYMQNEYLYNPAYTIDDPMLSAFLNSHIQWAGFGEGPRVNTFGIHGPILQNSGLGLTVMNNTSGLINSFEVSVDYAFRAKFADNHYLQLGAGAGVTSDKLGNPNEFTDWTDQILTSDEFSGSSFLASAGLAYFWNGLEAQIVLPQLYRRSEVNLYTIGVLAYNYEVNPTWTVKPSVMSRGVKTSPAQFDFSVMGTWNKMVWAQAGYRTNKSMIFALGFNLREFQLGYAHQMNGGDLAVVSNGTHEIQLIFNFGKSLYDDKPDKAVINGFVKSYTDKTPIIATIVVSQDGKEVLTTKSNDLGSYKAKLKPGKSYQVDVTADGYKSNKEIFTFEKDEYEKAITILLVSEKTVIKGTVLDANKKPVAAQIKVYDGDKEVRSVFSDPTTGEYNLEVEPGKTYTFKVVADNFEENVEKIEVKDTDETVNFNIPLVPIIPTVEVRGAIVDKDTKEAISTQINIYKDGKLLKTVNSNGSYKLELEEGSKYKVEYKSKDYLTQTVNYDLTKAGQDNKVQNIALAKIEKGFTFDLGTIEFVTGTSNLTDASYVTLNNVVKVMNEYPAINIEVGGHTDSSGGATTNKNLSQKRAQICADYILSKNIDASRISVKGYGESIPLVPNTTTENKAKNRRVEFVIAE